MLTGRESLIRLVGKRRRFLPNSQFLLSSPVHGSSKLCKDENRAAISPTGEEESSSKKRLGQNVEEMCAPPDWVTCPVCFDTVSGEDSEVNSHLDACLARGTKRKLKQRTLLQLNFCSQSNTGTHSGKSDQIRRAAAHKSQDSVVAEENNGKQCKSLLDSNSVLVSDDSAETLVNDEIVNYRVDSPPLFPENEMPKCKMALKTFIVGRKFSDAGVLNLGSSITLLRDPDNIKDCNAIKVLSADPGCCEVLGFLSLKQRRNSLQPATFARSGPWGKKKQDQVASLLASYADGLCPVLPTVVLEKTGTCIQISSLAGSLIWRAERLFFLNGDQDLSAFLLVDLGIVKYPDYDCVIMNQIFSGRDDLLAYEEAIEVGQVMDQSLDDNNTDLMLRCIELSSSRIPNSSPRATFFSCFTASWVYSKVVLLGVSFLERQRRYKDALNLLKKLLTCFTSDGRRGYWTLRLSIDLEHVGCPNESLSVAEDGLLDPWVRAGSRTALERRVLRLGKPPRRWKLPSFSEAVKRKITEVHIPGRPLNCTTGMKSRFYGEDGEQCGVEQLALQYYAGEDGGGWKGVHTESGIWLTIFGLLLWDVIFANIPDVFRTKFQTAPLDLATDSFYEARKSIIEPVLGKIHHGMAEEILITSWELHLGTACRGVNWDRHSLAELRAAVTCIGGPCLALMCRHLAQDYRSWSSGMPDLLLWRFHGEYRGEAKLVEVKGPRDRLSEQQRAWLLFLMDCGFITEVCKVSPVSVSG